MDLGKRRCLQVPTRRTAPVKLMVSGARSFFAARNEGRDRVLLQNGRRKFLNYFPFLFISKDFCVTRIAMMVEGKSNYIKSRGRGITWGLFLHGSKCSYSHAEVNYCSDSIEHYFIDEGVDRRSVWKE